MAVTSPMPPTSAVGIVRRGDSTSPAIRPSSHQPPNAKNAAMTEAASASVVSAGDGPDDCSSRAWPAVRATAATRSTATMASLAAAVHRITRALALRPTRVIRPNTPTAARAAGVRSPVELPTAASKYCARPMPSAAVRPGSITSSAIQP
jgi:hypothetical protein